MPSLKNEAVVVALAGLASIIACSFVLTEGHTWGDDFSAYLMQAQSLAEGRTAEFVERNTFTVDHSSWAFGPHAYPWGYPALLAPFQSVFGNDLWLFKGLNIACYLGFLVTLWLWLRSRLGQIDRLLVVLLFAVSPGVVPYTDQVMSDIPFLLLSTLGLWQIDRCTSRAAPEGASLAFAGLLILAATTVRSNGALLLPALLLADFLRRGPSEIPADALRRSAIPTAVLVLGLTGWSLAFGSGDISHLAVLGAVSPDVLRGNLEYYLHLPADFFSVLPVWVYYATLPFLAFGVARGGRSQAHLVLFAASTVALYMSTPFRQGIRYLFPVLPIYLYFTFLGMRAAAERRPRFARFLGTTVDVFWCTVLVCFVWICAEYASRNLENERQMEGPFDALSQEMFDYVAGQTPPDAIIVFFKARVLRMQTDRDAIMIDDYRELERGHYYVLHKQAGAKYQVPQQDLRRPEVASRLLKRWENERFVVFEIAGGGTARPSPRRPANPG